MDKEPASPSLHTTRLLVRLWKALFSILLWSASIEGTVSSQWPHISGRNSASPPPEPSSSSHQEKSGLPRFYGIRKPLYLLSWLIWGFFRYHLVPVWWNVMCPGSLKTPQSLIKVYMSLQTPRGRSLILHHIWSIIFPVVNNFPTSTGLLVKTGPTQTQCPIVIDRLSDTIWMLHY